MSDYGGSTPKAPEFEPNESFSSRSPTSSSPIASTSADTGNKNDSKNGKTSTTKSSAIRPAPYHKPAEASSNKNITCTHCKESLSRSEFTEQQLRKLRNEYDGSFTIFCKICSPKQQLTAECSECDKILPASDFARNQLSKAEGARCIKCQRKIDKRNSKRRKKGGYSDDESDEDSD